MRTFTLAALILVMVSFVMPMTASALVANGGYCDISPECQSGYCQGIGDYGGICQSSSVQTGTGNTNNQVQTGTGNVGVRLINPLQSGSSLSGFLQSILDFVIRIGQVVVILMMVFVGFKF